MLPFFFGKGFLGQLECCPLGLGLLGGGGVVFLMNCQIGYKVGLGNYLTNVNTIVLK